MHQQHLAGGQIRQQIFRAPADALDGRTLEPLVEIPRKRKAQVRPALLDPHEARALHHGLQAAAHGLDFGEFGHGYFSTRKESNARVTSGASASSLDQPLVLHPVEAIANHEAPHAQAEAPKTAAVAIVYMRVADQHIAPRQRRPAGSACRSRRRGTALFR